jgi:F0F1-type ATP synthase membrane subunit b/b'
MLFHIVPQIDFHYYIGQIFWTTIGFLGTYYIVKYIIISNIIGINKKRASIVTNNIMFAEGIIEKTKNLQNEINTKLKAANLEVQEIINKAKLSAIHIKEKEIIKAKESINDKISNSAIEIQSMVSKIQDEIKKHKIEIFYILFKQLHDTKIKNMTFEAFKEQFEKRIHD